VRVKSGTITARSGLVGIYARAFGKIVFWVRALLFSGTVRHVTV
jgi:hypothetical protein